MLCGREPGGIRVEEFGLCPSAMDVRFNGIHGGRNAGRACWVTAGSVNKRDIQGLFARKSRNCGTCDFYKMVRAEEGEQLLPTIFLIRILEDQASQHT